jgi:hypothetical protein
MKTDVGLWTHFVIRLRFSVTLLKFLSCINEEQWSACRQKHRRFMENKVMWSAFENYANFVMELLSEIKYDISVTERTGVELTQETGIEVSTPGGALFESPLTNQLSWFWFFVKSTKHHQENSGLLDGLGPDRIFPNPFSFIVLCNVRYWRSRKAQKITTWHSDRIHESVRSSVVTHFSVILLEMMSRFYAQTWRSTTVCLSVIFLERK